MLPLQKHLGVERSQANSCSSTVTLKKIRPKGLMKRKITAQKLFENQKLFGVPDPHFESNALSCRFFSTICAILFS